ncbi:MAG: 16S rRNA (adenine(1518)-N(6)/adenine(1519)-N(6))-dimethyltransferase RsmA [Luteolibacter sp.]
MIQREILQILAERDIRPSKQLGQNFLVDANIARWIVSRLDPQPDDAVVEVGPGTGALSEHLVGNVRRLILIEFDARLAAWLREKFAGRDDVEIHHADGAKFDARVLFKHRPVKFLGNLPYSSGGAIMRNFLNRPHPFERAVIMLQKEVIERLAAPPGGKDYGVLTLRVQSGWHVEPLRTVPPEAFHPRPNIDSSVAVLTPRDPAEFPPYDHRLFDELIRRGFAQRRKQLGKQLPASPPWAAVAKKLGLSPTTRAEQLTLTQWIDVAREYDPHPLKETPQHHGEVFDVVDENDQITGTATRAEVHANKWIHRAVHIFLRNKRGDVLLQQRSMLKDVHPGDWDSSVSGHLDSGETYEQAAYREVREEMGVESAELREIARIAPCQNTGWEHVRLFTADHHGALRYPCAEIQAAQWFPVDEIDAWTKSRPGDFATGFLECWRVARENDGGFCS